MKSKKPVLINRSALSFFYSAVVMIFLLFACGGGGGGGGGSSSGGGVQVYSKAVGPEGGTVTDPNGASVIIPAGALSETTTITISTYKDSAALEKKFGITPFRGGAEFGPDGTTFLKPVTITVPSGDTLQPYQKHALFVYDPVNKFPKRRQDYLCQFISGEDKSC